MDNNHQVIATIKNATERAEDYFRTTNDILGVFAFTSGIACLSIDNQSFYAWLSAFFLAFAWGSSFSSYKSRLVLLREIGHPKMKPFSVLKRCSVALAGWMFLAAVALNIFNKNGWVGF